MVKAVERLVDVILLSMLSKRARNLPSEYQQMAVLTRDFIGSEILVRGRYEREELEAISPLLERLGQGGVALDVGANVGNHAVFFSKYFNHVHSFEPNPRVFQLLEFNTQALTNVQLHKFGLSDSQKTIEAVVPANNAGGASVEEGLRAGSRVNFSMMDLDSTHIIESPVTFVKVDIEGHEGSALKGMSIILRSHHPVVMLECNRGDNVKLADDAIEILRGAGYDKFTEIAANRIGLPKCAPRGVRYIFRVVELFLRPAASACRLREVDQFEPRNYPAILASKGGLFV